MRLSNTRNYIPTIQHIIPISKGGTHEIENIAVICLSCNTSLGNKECLGKLNNQEVKNKWEQIQKGELIPNVYKEKENVYTDKIRLDKNRLDNKENIKKKVVFVKPSLDDIQNYISEKGLKVNAKQFFDYFEAGDWVDSKGQKVKNWKQKLLTWNKYAKDDPVNIKFYDPNNQYENIDGLFANEKEEK